MRHVAAAAIALSLAGNASAQSSAEINAGIQYNFASPGARSLARAGAFIADASDATAVYTNPAGLVSLPAREVSIELRHSRFTHTYSDRGHAFGPASNKGVDTIEGIDEGHSSDDVDNVPFASLVIPFDRITFAAYRHELANFAASARTQGVFYDRPEGNSAGIPRHYPAVGDLRLNIVGTGVAAGFRVNRRFSVGIGARRYAAHLDSATLRYDTIQLSNHDPGGPNYDRLISTQTQHGSGDAIGFNAGFVLDLTRRISIGATYRQGFSFPVEVHFTDRFGTNDPPRHGRFNVPSFLGNGLSIRPNDYWSIAIDVNRINYSATTRGHVFLFNEEPRYLVPDGTEVRVGTEVLITPDMGGVWSHLPIPITLAAGAWRDPDHAIRVSEPTDAQAVLFRPAKDDYHVSAGFGLIFGKWAQVHAAIDRSSRQTVASISTMARF